MAQRQEPHLCYHTTDVINKFHFNFNEAVEDPRLYSELLQVLRTAGETDEIHVYMNTPGGRLDSMVQIITNMRNSNAKVVAHLEGICHSAGTFIFLAADEWVVNPNCILLFHNYSGGSWGKGNEMLQQVLATDRWFKQIADDVYYPFLSREEISTVLSGQDKWMDSDEVMERLEDVAAYREEQMINAQRESRLAVKEEIDKLVEQDTAPEE